MDYQTKTMVVNALTKLVDEAPTKSAVQFTLYPQTYVVTKERFDIWVKYIFSIMQIISSYVDVSICLSNINVITPELEHRKSGYVERKRRPYQGNVVRIA